MTIGDRIKQRRLELNMSQDELAKKVGYKSRSSINKIELARDLPLKKVEEMADALEVTPGYLMGWSDEKYVMPAFPGFEEIDSYRRHEEFLLEHKKRMTIPQHILAYVDYFEKLNKSKNRELLDAADGCSDPQIDAAINVLNTFKNIQDK